MNDFIRMCLYTLQRSLVPAMLAIVLAAAILAVAYGIHRHRHRGQQRFPWKRAVLWLAAAGYAAIVLYITLGRPSGIRGLNLHIFRAWREAWNTFSVKGWLNLLLNVGMFIPIGMLLPLLWKRARTAWLGVGCGVAASLAIELVQYASMRGTADIDDLIANTVGCTIGYCLVMVVLRLRQRQTAAARGYALIPAAVVLVFAITVGQYAMQAYGNLEIAPIYRVDTSETRWMTTIELPDEPVTAPVYQAKRLSQDEGDAAGLMILTQLGVSGDIDIAYYDDVTYFMQHLSPGAFLHLDLRDGSYDYQYHADLEPAQLEENELRWILDGYGMSVPTNAEYTYTQDEWHRFSLYGDLAEDLQTLQVRCSADGTILELENHMVPMTQMEEQSILTPAQACTRLCSGNFNNVYLESLLPTEITVNSYELSFYTDSKGFYQPVYRFSLSAPGAERIEVILPALAD